MRVSDFLALRCMRQHFKKHAQDYGALPWTPQKGFRLLCQEMGLGEDPPLMEYVRALELEKQTKGRRPTVADLLATTKRRLTEIAVRDSIFGVRR